MNILKQVKYFKYAKYLQRKYLRASGLLVLFIIVGIVFGVPLIWIWRDK